MKVMTGNLIYDYYYTYLKQILRLPTFWATVDWKGAPMLLTHFSENRIIQYDYIYKKKKKKLDGVERFHFIQTHCLVSWWLYGQQFAHFFSWNLAKTKTVRVDLTIICNFTYLYCEYVWVFMLRLDITVAALEVSGLKKLNTWFSFGKTSLWHFSIQ